MRKQSQGDFLYRRAKESVRIEYELFIQTRKTQRVGPRLLRTHELNKYYWWIEVVFLKIQTICICEFIIFQIHFVVTILII